MFILIAGSWQGKSLMRSLSYLLGSLSSASEQDDEVEVVQFQ